MKKVKVIRIIARLNVGGPAKHVVILTDGLTKTRYDSMLIYGATEPGEGDMSYLAKNCEIKYAYIPNLVRSINPIGDLRALINIFTILKKERPHIVHTHTAKAGTLGRIAAMLARVPVKVHTFHGHIFYGYFNKLLTEYFLLIEKVLAYFTDRIIAISDKQKEELLHKYNIGIERKYNVINIGLDLERFLQIETKRGRFRERYRFKGDDILLGIIGRLVPIKNHKIFIRMARSLKNSLKADIFEKVKFIIIGDGPEKSSLVEYAKLQGVAERLLFTGWIDDMEEVYADLDIVALTSKNEGTPLSLIEALASAKPVVSMDVGGVREIVGDAGILVEKGDESTFSQSLLKLILSPSLRQEMRMRGREGVMKKFSRENLLTETEKLYEELLSEKGISG